MQSRYYDPEIGRFLNADSYATTGQGVMGHNMFAYCNNNATNYVDFSGSACCFVYLSDDPFAGIFFEMGGGGGGCSYGSAYVYMYANEVEKSGHLEERQKPMFGGTRYTDILPWVYSVFEISNEGITLIDASIALTKVSFLWDYLDLTITPFDAFSAEISAGLNREDGLHASAIAYMAKPSLSFELFGLDVTFFAYFGAVGAEMAFSLSNGVKFGVAPNGYGGGFSITWDDK